MATYPVIDADGHVFEPDWIWERFLDPRFVDRRPRLVRDERGNYSFAHRGLVEYFAAYGLLAGSTRWGRSQRVPEGSGSTPLTASRRADTMGPWEAASPFSV